MAFDMRNAEPASLYKCSSCLDKDEPLKSIARAGDQQLADM